jgi:hypothetical protein
VETGDGRTEDIGGLTRNEENVIRLPRDWLGPPEELVPIGPAARARAAQRDRDDGMPPAADAFWSEDSAALHDAVQAPDAGPERLDPTVDLLPSVGGLRSPGLDRLARLSSFRGRTGKSRWWALVAVPIAAILVLAVIGTSEGPASHPRAADASASHGSAPTQSASSSLASSGNAAKAKLTAHVSKRQRHTSSRGHARTRPRKARPVKTHHRTPVHHASGSPAPTVTTEAAAATETHSNQPTSSTTPASTTASTVASAVSKPAPAPPGPTRLGSMSGGCTPKCP